MADFTTVATTGATPEETFDYICDLSKWPTFRGYGPLPGIVEASIPPGTTIGPGTRVAVLNTDGSRHHEVVVEWVRGKRYAVRMELTPPASLLMSGMQEFVDLEPVAGGTRITRRFVTTPRSIVTAPLVWLVGGVLLKKAVERHNAVVAAAFR